MKHERWQQAFINNDSDKKKKAYFIGKIWAQYDNNNNVHS